MSKVSKFFKSPVKFFSDSWFFKRQSKNTISTKKLAKPIAKTPSITELMTQLNKFEIENPLCMVKYQDRCAWNVLRYGIWMKLWKMNQGSKFPSRFNGYSTTISLAMQKNYETSCNAVQVSKTKTDPVDFLIFINVNASDRLIKNGLTYNRIMDPVFEELMQIGTAKKVCLLRTPSGLIGEPMHHEPLYLMADLRRTLNYYEELQMPHGFMAQLSKSFVNIGLTESNVFGLIDSYQQLKMSFREVLLKFKPKAVFFMNLGIHMPLCEAAKDLGIKTIEIQHGAQKANTPIYNDWVNFPLGGYDGLPTHFGVWGDADAKHIRKVFKNTVKPIVLGCPWIVRADNYSASEKCLQVFSRVREKYSRIVLITMQNQEKFPIELLNLVQESASVAWIVRKHPKWNRLDTSQIDSLPNVFKDEVLQKESVFDLLKLVDIHVTRDSTSAYEANYLGIPSFVFGDGLTMYADELKDGTVGNLAQLQELIADDEGFSRALEDYKKKYKGALLADVSLGDELRRIFTNEEKA